MLFKLKKFTYLISLVLLTGVLLTGVLLVGSSAEELDKVATVNGEPLDLATYTQQLEQTKAAYKQQQGLDLDAEENKETLKQVKQMLLDEMINHILLLQQAQKEGIQPKADDIQEQVTIIKSQFPDEAQFEEALKASSLSLADLEKEISDLLIIDQYLVSAIPNEKITVSEEEVNAYYDDYKKQFEQSQAGASVPELKEIKSQIVVFLEEQKILEAKKDLLKNLKDDSEIKILI